MSHSPKKVLTIQLCPTLCDPMGCSPPGSSVHLDSPGKNTGVGCHALLQGIFLIQGLNLGLLHCRQILYCLSHQGSPPKSLVLPDSESISATWDCPSLSRPSPSNLQPAVLEATPHTTSRAFLKQHRHPEPPDTLA